jgi:SAM-dependent methyltransferase
MASSEHSKIAQPKLTNFAAKEFMPSVLNVGGNNKRIALPACYDGWEHLLLDIDAAGQPDLVLDARLLETIEPAQFDSIYCSHNLEHYYRHEATKVLRGFRHVLKPAGFAYIRVPDLESLFRIVVARNLDLNDFLYESPAGPITVCDVIYGYGREIERSGNDFFAHKNGFSEKSLVTLLQALGFTHIFHQSADLEITAFAFLDRPSPEIATLLNLPNH